MSKDTDHKGRRSDFSLSMDELDRFQFLFHSNGQTLTTSYDNEFVMNFNEDTSVDDYDQSVDLHRAEIQLLHIMMKFSLPNEAYGMVMK